MNIDNPLFNYMKPQNNDMFSKMSDIDLQDLLYYLEKYYLELRNHLGFDNDVTFGFELEFENTSAMIRNIETEIMAIFPLDTWELKDDFTLHNGAEIISPPLRDRSSDWNELKKACSIISEYASIGTNCGGHIHIGVQVMDDKTSSWLNFIKLWSVYENIIYRFTYGEFLTARSSIVNYAKPVAEIFLRDYQDLKENSKLNMGILIDKISHQRNQAVNFNNVEFLMEEVYKNTIEFRCPNGTLNPIIWQNNVNLFVHMLLYSKSSRYNDDIIQNRRNINADKYFNLDCYHEIYLQQALELCDMIFTNNVDKVYFLRQYLKSFETGNKELSIAKPFTKKINI